MMGDCVAERYKTKLVAKATLRRRGWNLLGGDAYLCESCGKWHLVLTNEWHDGPLILSIQSALDAGAGEVVGTVNNRVRVHRVVVDEKEYTVTYDKRWQKIRFVQAGDGVDGVSGQD